MNLNAYEQYAENQFLPIMYHHVSTLKPIQTGCYWQPPPTAITTNHNKSRLALHWL